MFGELPFFMGLGFCLGLWQGDDMSLLSIALQRRATHRALLAQAIFLALAGFLVILLFRMLSGAPIAAGLSFAAAIVGWTGGRWFAFAHWGRDKAVAIAAAALFIAVSAYEYDTGTLRNVTDFSAGSVHLAFSPGASSEKTGLTIGGLAATKSEPFPGRNRLKLSLYYLENIPTMICRDEQYAELFSGFDKESAPIQNSYCPNAPVIVEPATEQLLNYYNSKIVPFVKILAALQDYHKGEIASISLEPTVIHDLRLAYERTAMLWPLATAGSDFATSLCSGAERAAGEARILETKEKGGSADKLHKVQNCTDRTNPSWQFPSLIDSGIYTQADAYEFVAYFTMTLALAEFTMENRERAIQLLDDFIVRGSPYDAEENKSRAADANKARAYARCVGASDLLRVNSCEEAAGRLADTRRLVVRARLEALEDNIIEVSENSGLTAIRISLLNRAIHDMDMATNLFRAAADFDEQPLFGAHVGSAGGSCWLRSPADTQSKVLAARWLAAVTTLRANALQAAADSPDVVSVKPFLIPVLDAYAAKVEAFDADCANRISPLEPIDDSLRSNLLAAVGAYWKAKGERFGVAAKDAGRLVKLGLDHRAQLAALCEAMKSFQFASQIRPSLTANGVESEDSMTLDQRGASYRKPVVEERTDSGYAEAAADLDAFSKGEVEKYCP